MKNIITGILVPNFPSHKKKLMIFNFKQTFSFSLICAGLLLNSLHAAHLTTEFYPAMKPSECDTTAIKLKGWPQYEHVEVFETRLEEPKKMRNPIKLKKGETPTVEVSSPGYYPGEAVEWTFVDTPNKIEESVTLVPLPIYAKSTKDSAKVEARLIQFHSPTTYAIELENFKDGEEIIFESNSYHEQSSSRHLVSETKIFHYMPGVMGKLGGNGKVKIKRSSGETLQLELPWGLEFMKYSFYTDEKGQVKRLIDTKEFSKKHPTFGEYFKMMR